MTKYLMEVNTGSVDTEEDWLAEMPGWETNGDGLSPEEQLETLVEVRRATDEEKAADPFQGDWVEVK